MFLSFVTFVSFLNRFFNRLNYQSYIVVKKSTNHAGIGRLKPTVFPRVSRHDSLRKQFRQNNQFKRPKQTETENNDYTVGLNRLRENNTTGKPMNGGQRQQGLEAFKHDWCRLQRARLEWKEVLGPCLNFTVWEEPTIARLGVNQITDPSKSFISHWDIGKTGEFSRFFIQTVSTSNMTKSFGGDSWRIHIQGPSSLAPLVLDHSNGTYEVLFLIIEDGDYDAKIFLDYSICHGFKDPPPYWFKKGKVT